MPNDELEVFFPKVRQEGIAGKLINIPNLKVRQLSAFAKASEPFMPLIVTGDYLAVLTHHTEAACQARDTVVGNTQSSRLRMASSTAASS